LKDNKDARRVEVSSDLGGIVDLFVLFSLEILFDFSEFRRIKSRPKERLKYVTHLQKHNIPTQTYGWSYEPAVLVQRRMIEKMQPLFYKQDKSFLYLTTHLNKPRKRHDCNRESLEYEADQNKLDNHKMNSGGHIQQSSSNVQIPAENEKSLVAES
jgi:hypothetical protein